MRCERGGHLRAQGHFAFTLVDEVEKLSDQFPAALFFVKIDAFQGRAIHLDKAVPPRHLAPLTENVLPRRAIGGVEIAKPGKRLESWQQRERWQREERLESAAENSTVSLHFPRADASKLFCHPERASG